MNLYEKIEEAIDERDVNTKSQIITVAVNMTIEAIKAKGRITPNELYDGWNNPIDGSYLEVYLGEIEKLIT